MPDKFCKQRFVKNKSDNLGNLKSSLCAGVITSIITNPYWVIYARYLLSEKKSDGKKTTFLTIIKKILDEEGFKGFLKGT